MIDKQTQEIIELVKSGLNAVEAANVLATKRLLGNGHAPAPVAVALPPRTAAPDPWPDDHKGNGHSNGHSDKSVVEVVAEFCSVEDVLSAPTGYRWEIPVARVCGTEYGSRLRGKKRTTNQCRGAVAHAFWRRRQNKLVAVSCHRGDRTVVITKLDGEQS